MPSLLSPSAQSKMSCQYSEKKGVQHVPLYHILPKIALVQWGKDHAAQCLAGWDKIFYFVGTNTFSQKFRPKQRESDTTEGVQNSGNLGIINLAGFIEIGPFQLCSKIINFHRTETGFTSKQGRIMLADHWGHQIESSYIVGRRGHLRLMPTLCRPFTIKALK